MKAKEYLKQIEILDKKINNRIRELYEIKSRTLGLKAISYDKVSVQGSGAADKMAEQVARWIDIEKEINRLTDRLINEKHKIIGEIERLSDPRHIELLMMRYVECMTFEDIARSMNYDVRWIYSLHGSALQEFERVHFNSC